MSIIDWGVLALFVIAMLVMGFVFSKEQKDTKNYFLGNKSIPWWACGLSIIATETSALTFIGIPAMAYTSNMKYVQIAIGYVLARIIIIIFMIPKYFAGKEIYSPYELLADKFGKSSKNTAAFFFLISGSLSAGVRIYVTAIPLMFILGISITNCILIFGIIAIAYTFLGGIKAVIWSDVVQFIIFMLGGIFALIYIPTLVNGGFSQVMAEASVAGKLAWLDTSFSINGDFNIWMGLIGASIGIMISHGSDQLLVQRILSCKNKLEGQKAMLLSSIIILPLFVIFLFIGVMLFCYYQHNTFAILPYDSAGNFKADYIFPIFIISHMPIVIKGFLISALFAAAMSSVDSALSALSSVYVMNIHKDIVKNKTEDYFIKLSKKIIIVQGVILIFVAFLCKDVELILNTAFELGGITGGALLGSILFAMYSKKTNKQMPVIIGMVTSFLCMLTIVVLTKSGMVEIAWPWYALIGTSAMLITANIVHYFTDLKKLH